MASAAGKCRTEVKDDLFLYDITPEPSETKLRPSGSLSADTKRKIKSKTPRSAVNSGTLKIKKEAGFLIQFFSELDDFQDILEGQQQIQDLDKRIELKRLELQHLQKHESPNLTSPSMLLYNPVPGPAAFQNATPIMLVHDPDQAISTDSKSGLFQVLRPHKVVSPQRWPHHCILFGMSQKSYKELLMPEFLSILLEFPDEIHQNQLL